MSSQFAEWVEIAEETGGHLDFSIYDVLHDWRQDRAQRDAERDDLVTACHKFSWAHFTCHGEGCTDTHCDPQDWAEFDRAIVKARGQ